MTEQPLWRRQQAALAAEQAAPPGVMIQETRDAQAVAARVQAQIRDDALVADLLAPYTIGHGTATPASGGWGVAGIMNWTPTDLDEWLGLPPRPALRPPTPEEVRAWVDSMPDPQEPGPSLP